MIRHEKQEGNTFSDFLMVTPVFKEGFLADPNKRGNTIDVVHFNGRTSREILHDRILKSNYNVMPTVIDVVCIT